MAALADVIAEIRHTLERISAARTHLTQAVQSLTTAHRTYGPGPRDRFVTICAASLAIRRGLSREQTPADVRRLIEVLARPDTSEAHLVHDDRPLRHDSVFDQDVADHQVFVTVMQGFGHIEFFDPGHWSQPVGDPASPEWHATTSGHFLAGTGISVEVLIEAVIEFFLTAQRPTCVRWREVGGGHE